MIFLGFGFDFGEFNSFWWLWGLGCSFFFLLFLDLMLGFGLGCSNSDVFDWFLALILEFGLNFLGGFFIWLVVIGGGWCGGRLTCSGECG